MLQGYLMVLALSSVNIVAVQNLNVLKNGSIKLGGNSFVDS